MSKPTFADYIDLLRRPFRACPEPKRRGRPYTYRQISLLLFFAVMTLRPGRRKKLYHRPAGRPGRRP